MGVAMQNRSCIDIIPQFMVVFFELSACSSQWCAQDAPPRRLNRLKMN